MFHIHIGTQNNIDENDAYALIKVCDLFLGVPSVLIDLDTDRRELYGKAGECRLRVVDDYIVLEYRSLGGNLLASDEIISWVYDNIVKAIEFYNQGDFSFLNDAEKIISCINNSDRNLAKELCDAYNIHYPQISVDKENVVYYHNYQTVEA